MAYSRPAQSLGAPPRGRRALVKRNEDLLRARTPKQNLIRFLRLWSLNGTFVLCPTHVSERGIFVRCPAREAGCKRYGVDRKRMPSENITGGG
eukprot:scaffold9177_cov101-Isochrysis_galbana.AAC.2